MENDPDSYFGPIILLQALSPVEVIAGTVAFFLLLLCSALISGSEAAFFSLTHRDFEKLALENTKSSRRILVLKEKALTLTAAMMVSHYFIYVAVVLIANFILSHLLPAEIAERWSAAFIGAVHLEQIVGAGPLAAAVRFLIAVAFVATALLLFGEIMPKMYARRNNVRVAKQMSGSLLFIAVIFYPLSRILERWPFVAKRRLSDHGGGAGREDIDKAIELSAGNENGENQEMDILKSIVKFGDLTVKQIMRSRVDVIAVDFRIDFRELLQVVRESGYSRIPVYDTDFDNVTGILYVKDLLGRLQEDSGFKWQELIRANVLYIPEAKKISDLLKEFQKQRLHMAVVVDEYGGSSGIVTLEDIMEEVIGEIRDEFDDDAEVIFKKIDDYNYLIEGKTLLNDVCRILGIDTSTFDPVKGEADSLAGLILELYGQLPQKDIEIHYQHFRFKIASVSKRRIEQILVTLPKS